jgi:hypothetical protein
VGKPEGKKPLGRPWHRLACNITNLFKEIVRESVEWIYMAQDGDKRSTVVKGGNESADSIKCREYVSS